MSNFYTAFEKQFDVCLKPRENFDIVKRELLIGSKRAAVYFIDGFIKDEMYEKVFEFFFSQTVSDMEKIEYMEDFSKTKMPYVEVDVSYDIAETKMAVLSGVTALIIDGVKGVLLIDTRSYPSNTTTYSEDKSFKGSQVRFADALITNTALIRRHIRDAHLRMEYMRIGEGIKLDIVVSYIDGRAEERTVKLLKERLSEIKISSPLTSQALCERLVKSSSFNPYPKFRFTDRPDFASANILEGKIVIIIDNCPSVMILPVSFADFLSEADDTYFLPIVSSYIRIIRLITAILTVVATPIYLLLINNPRFIPDWLLFIKPASPTALGLFAQLLILEFLIDGMRLCSLNVRTHTSGGLGIIGGLLLAVFAVNTGWFTPEAILITAFICISAFHQPSRELGYAMKLERILLLICVQLFGLYGLLGGLVFIALAMRLTKTLTGRNYLYPIIPFDLKDFLRLFIKIKTKK